MVFSSFEVRHIIFCIQSRPGTNERLLKSFVVFVVLSLSSPAEARSSLRAVEPLAANNGLIFNKSDASAQNEDFHSRWEDDSSRERQRSEINVAFKGWSCPRAVGAPAFLIKRNVKRLKTQQVKHNVWQSHHHQHTLAGYKFRIEILFKNRMKKMLKCCDFVTMNKLASVRLGFLGCVSWLIYHSFSELKFISDRFCLLANLKV